MFVPAAMSEVDIFVFEDNIDTVAQTVAEMGVMHLLDAKTLGQWGNDTDVEWAGRVNQYRHQERRILDLLRQLDIAEQPFQCDDRLRPGNDLGGIERDLRLIEDEVTGLREQELALRRSQERWRMIAQSMERIAPLSVTIADLRQLEQLHMVAGTLPSENIARLEASLFRIPYTIIPVHRYQGRSLVFAFCAQTHAPILDRALESAFLDPLALPEEFDGTGREVLAQFEKEMAVDSARLEEIQAQYAQIAAQDGDRLLAILTKVRREAAVSDAMAHFGHRGHVYLIAGWVPKDKVDSLRSAVQTATDGRATFEENPADVLGSRVMIPTLLRNPKLLRSVESLVSTYGTPGYREIDPTLLVAITFVLMFGIMFGDLGHGMILALVGGLLSFGVIGHSPKLRQMGNIPLACGISSSIFGLLYGSVFGMEDIIPHLWLAPMTDILPLLLASIIFGVITLNIGFACRLATAVRAGDLRAAIFDKNGLVGLGLYWSLGAVVIYVAMGKTVPGIVYICVMVLIMCIFAAEPLTRLIEKKRPLIEGNMVEVGIQAFFELFEALIGYLSNTLSYVRLGAFAVAHAGLSMVVIMLADMLGNNAPLRIAILVLGNIVVMLFEGVIVAIQTLRLEYYELFGKFYLGEGVPFKPLTLPTDKCAATERA